jgi:hypothetical protein
LMAKMSSHTQVSRSTWVGAGKHDRWMTPWR